MCWWVAQKMTRKILAMCSAVARQTTTRIKAAITRKGLTCTSVSTRPAEAPVVRYMKLQVLARLGWRFGPKGADGSQWSNIERDPERIALTMQEVCLHIFFPLLLCTVMAWCSYRR